MPNLTTKELAALQDQIGIEKMMSCKYTDASNRSTDPALKTSYQNLATQHQQTHATLLQYLR